MTKYCSVLDGTKLQNKRSMTKEIVPLGAKCGAVKQMLIPVSVVVGTMMGTVAGTATGTATGTVTKTTTNTKLPPPPPFHPQQKETNKIGRRMTLV